MLKPTPPTISIAIENLEKKKLSQKKPHSSSSSGTHSFFNEKQWLFPFPMLELLPEQTQKYVAHQITKQAVKKGLKQNDTNVFNDVRFLNIIKPYRRLNEFLNNTPRRNLALQFIHIMLYEPFTISDITLPYDFEKRKETKAFQSFVRRIANLLIKCKLLEPDTVKPKKYGIPDNPKFYTTILYFNPDLINKEDLIYDEIAGQIIKLKQIDAELGRPYKTAEQKAQDYLDIKSEKQRILTSYWEEKSSDLKQRIEYEEVWQKLQSVSNKEERSKLLNRKRQLQEELFGKASLDSTI